MAARFYEKHGLRNCVGIVDGTPVIFIQKPAVDGETFFDRYTSSCLLYAMRKCILCCVVYVFEYIHWKALYKWGRLSPFFFFTGKAATRSICNWSVMTRHEFGTSSSGSLVACTMETSSSHSVRCTNLPKSSSPSSCGPCGIQEGQ